MKSTLISIVLALGLTQASYAHDMTNEAFVKARARAIELMRQEGNRECDPHKYCRMRDDTEALVDEEIHIRVNRAAKGDKDQSRVPHRMVVGGVWVAYGALIATGVYACPDPREPSQARKVWALQLGYALNQNSMVRWGSIDVTPED